MEPSLQVVVTLSADGRLNVQTAGTAAGNVPMIVGLLEMAKNAVQQPPKEPAASPLLLARGSLPKINGR